MDMGVTQRSSQQPAFNLSEQSGVLAALLAVRTSDLSAAEKNDLRDQIFTYTKSGGDERLREQVEQKLASLPLSEQFLEQQQEKQKTESRSGFAGARRTPSFAVKNTAAPTVAKEDTSKPATPNVSEQATAAPDQTQAAPPAAAPATSSAQAPATPTPTPTPAPAEPAAAAPAAGPDQAQPQAPAAQEPDPASVTPDQPVPTTAAPAPATAEPAPASAPSAGSGEPTIERIREIKRYINNAVGNPVNLVDIDSQVGRAYMSALLAAMQSVNAETGRAGDSEMQQLESVFAQVKELLAAQEAGGKVQTPAEPATPSQPAPEPVPQPTTPPQSAPTAPEPAAPRPTPEAPAEPAAQSPAQPAPVPQPNTQGEPTVSPTIRSVAADASAEQAERRQTAATPTEQPAAQSEPEPAPQPTTPPEPEPAPQSVPEAPKAPEPAATPASSSAEQTPASTPVTSLGAETETDAHSFTPQSTEGDDARTDGPSQSVVPPIFASEKQANTQPHAATAEASSETASAGESASGPASSTSHTTESVSQDETTTTTPTGPVGATAQASADPDSTIAGQLHALDEKAAQNQYAGDPLYAPEVDAGLQQLLLEWNLFKSSGLFGTGPNGREHPLFKKLAPMMVQDVASGRFDDARPEVTQSITDYMNGWRYEQGIVYEPGETFEKYLRRVIRFILDSKG